MGNDAESARWIRVGNPDVDFNVVVEFVGQRDELDFRREGGKKFRGYCCWISHT